MITIYQSQPGMIVFSHPHVDYGKCSINDDVYIDLKKFGVTKERIQKIDFDGINKKLIATIR